MQKDENLSESEFDPQELDAGSCIAEAFRASGLEFAIIEVAGVSCSVVQAIDITHNAFVVEDR